MSNLNSNKRKVNKNNETSYFTIRWAKLFLKLIFILAGVVKQVLILC